MYIILLSEPTTWPASELQYVAVIHLATDAGKESEITLLPSPGSYRFMDVGERILSQWRAWNRGRFCLCTSSLLAALVTLVKGTLINGSSGYIRDNTSWVLGRIMRDLNHCRDPIIDKSVDRILNARWENIKQGDRAASARHKLGWLRASLNINPARIPVRVRLYWSVILVLVFSALHCGHPVGTGKGTGESHYHRGWDHPLSHYCLFWRGSGPAAKWLRTDMPDRRKWQSACYDYSQPWSRPQLGGSGWGQRHLEADKDPLTRAALFILAVFWVLLLRLQPMRGSYSPLAPSGCYTRFMCLFDRGDRKAL
ncbi:hypothetical protein BDV10DRAFT_175781 [Aspergillus recurvatus]